MSEGSLAVVVLAAGKGTRMRSALPKVLQPVCGKPMAWHVIQAARELHPKRIVVVAGYGGELVRQALGAEDTIFVEQTELLGTADAVARARTAAQDCDDVLVLNGDSPLITPELLHRLVTARGAAPFSFATCRVPDVGSFGRVIRDGLNQVLTIEDQFDVNAPDVTAERNAGQYAFEGAWLWGHIDAIPPAENGEFYLPLLAKMAHDVDRPAVSVDALVDDVMGFDDRIGLAEAERLMRARILRRHMLGGVTIADPATTYIDAGVVIAEDVTILPGCHILGDSDIATGAVIGPNTTLRNALVGTDTVVRHSVVEETKLGARVNVGPFAHTRGGAVIGDDCELGNYAEVKNSVIGRGVKMHHFSYMGDADVGEGTNIAAGTITCNYDGVNKHRTTIGAGAFIGCDTMLVAPITVGDGAATAAGSVVTKDVAPGERVAGVPARPMAARSK